MHTAKGTLQARRKMDFDIESLDTLKYSQLQSLCKKYKIKANQKKDKLVSELLNLYEVGEICFKITTNLKYGSRIPREIKELWKNK